MRIVNLRGVAVAVAVLLAGCCETQRLFDSTHACTQDQVGSANIAVLSVAEWEPYADAVQPTFTLSPADALVAAIPNTQSIEDKMLDVLAAKLKLALPRTSLTDTTTSGTGQATKTARAATKQSGDASALSFEDNPAKGLSAADLPPSSDNSVLSKSLGTDAMLKYWAAMALYEEVQLLNRSVKDAAKDENYTPYVVRMQVTLMPRLRKAPYDAYTSVSFLMGDFSPHLDKSFRGMQTDPNKETMQSHLSIAVKRPQSPNPQQLKLIPLLVTDDLESALHSRSLDQIRQVALALSAMVGGAGVATDIQGTNEKLQTILGQDFNSTFTVARVTEDTIRCRFGAMNQVADQYSMVPQTHNVTVLVLVPKDRRQLSQPKHPAPAECVVRLAARTEFREVSTGNPVPSATFDQLGRGAQKILDQYDIKIGWNDEDKRKLVKLGEAVYDQNFEQFACQLSDLANSQASAKFTLDEHKHFMFAEEAWVQFTSLLVRYSYAWTHFGIPKHHDAEFVGPAKAQTAILMDDGKTMTATLWGGKDLLNGKFQATLKTKDKHVFVATAAKPSVDGLTLQLEFPSLKTFGYMSAEDVTKKAEEQNADAKQEEAGKKKKPDKKEPAPGNGDNADKIVDHSKLTVISSHDEEITTLINETPTLYQSSVPDAKPEFSVDCAAKALVANPAATLHLTVSGLKDKNAKKLSTDKDYINALLQVSGADVVAVTDAKTGKLLDPKDAAWIMPGDGVVQFTLTAVTGQDITIIAVDSLNKGKSAPIVLKVVDPPYVKKSD